MTADTAAVNGAALFTEQAHNYSRQAITSQIDTNVCITDSGLTAVLVPTIVYAGLGPDTPSRCTISS
jgi:hypothetical protein